MRVWRTGGHSLTRRGGGAAVRPRALLVRLSPLLGALLASALLVAASWPGGRPGGVAWAATPVRSPDVSQTVSPTPVTGAVMTLSTPATGVRVGAVSAVVSSRPATAPASPAPSATPAATATPAAGAVSPGSSPTPVADASTTPDPGAMPSPTPAAPTPTPDGTVTGSPAATAAPVAAVSPVPGASRPSILGALNSPLDGGHYDDDPGPGPGSPYYQVSPNLDDTPLRMGTLVVALSSPGQAADIRETIQSQGPDANNPGDDVLVYDTTVRAAPIKTGQPCLALLGGPRRWSRLADGLMSTGQQSLAGLQSLVAGCADNTLGVLQLSFPVSRYLPPGWYDHCVALATGDATGAPSCRAFHVNAVTGYQVDTNTVNFGKLEAGAVSTMPGDFNPSSASAGTAISTGNTSLVLTVEFSWMEARKPSPPSSIKDGFGVALRRRNSSRAIVASQELDGLLGGADPQSADPFAGATPAVLTTICLEPGEPVRLDFFVQPSGTLENGAYDGHTRFSAAVSPTCTPSLGPGEGAAGDADGPWNNTPGVPVSQVNLHP